MCHARFHFHPTHLDGSSLALFAPCTLRLCNFRWSLDEWQHCNLEIADSADNSEITRHPDKEMPTPWINSSCLLVLLLLGPNQRVCVCVCASVDSFIWNLSERHENKSLFPRKLESIELVYLIDKKSSVTCSRWACERQTWLLIKLDCEVQWTSSAVESVQDTHRLIEQWEVMWAGCEQSN